MVPKLTVLSETRHPALWVLADLDMLHARHSKLRPIFVFEVLFSRRGQPISTKQGLPEISAASLIVVIPEVFAEFAEDYVANEIGASEQIRDHGENFEGQ